MAKLDIPFLTSRPGRHGARRYYWQPSSGLREQGWRIERLPDDLGAAIKRAQEINRQLDEWRRGVAPGQDKTTARPGTLADLIYRYKHSRFFANKAEKTRREYDRCLTIIRDWSGDAPLAAVTAPIIQRWYEAMFKRTPAQANALLRIMRLLMQHGVREGMISTNPASKPGMIGLPQSGKLWPAEAVQLMVEVADRMGRHSIGTAILINWWLGQRQGDVIRLKRSQYRDGRFWITQRKTGARVSVPHSPLIAARVEGELRMQATRKVSSLSLIVSETTGAPYSSYNFQHLFADIRGKAAEIWPSWEQDDQSWLKTTDLQFMHLRHTAITELANAGATIEEIASISGHTLGSVTQILERYLIRTSHLAQNATDKRLARAEQEH